MLRLRKLYRISAKCTAYAVGVSSMKLKKIFVCILCFLLLMGAVCFHEEVADAVIDAGSRCVLVIIPSLYLFSVLAAFCVRTGLLELIAVLCDKFSRKLLRMDGMLLMVLLFSQFAGYPVGAQLLQQLRQKNAITETQTQTMLCVCIGCGPAFLMGTVCASVQLPLKLTLLFMLCIILPNLICAAILAKRGGLCRTNRQTPRFSMDSTIFTGSVESGAAAMLKICSMILLFAALLGMADLPLRYLAAYLGISSEVTGNFLSVFLEISNITEFLRGGGSLAAAAAMLSFGGICVHLQNAALCGVRFPWGKFLAIRSLCALSTALLWKVAVNFLCREEIRCVALPEPACSPSVTPESAVPILCLVVMSLLLLAEHNRLRCCTLKGASADKSA